MGLFESKKLSLRAKLIDQIFVGPQIEKLKVREICEIIFGESSASRLDTVKSCSVEVAKNWRDKIFKIFYFYNFTIFPLR